jgi:hypothetical protein
LTSAAAATRCYHVVDGVEQLDQFFGQYLPSSSWPP